MMDARLQCFWGGTPEQRYERALKELNYATMTIATPTLKNDTVLEYRSDDSYVENMSQQSDLSEDLDFSQFDEE